MHGATQSSPGHFGSIDPSRWRSESLLLEYIYNIIYIYIHSISYVYIYIIIIYIYIHVFKWSLCESCGHFKTYIERAVVIVWVFNLFEEGDRPGFVSLSI